LKELRRAPDPRETAFRILDRVERTGAFASVLLEREGGRFDDGREAGLLTELVLGVLRRREALDHVLRGIASRPLERVDSEVRTLLRLGAYGLLWLDRVPAFAAVDTTVQLARETGHASAAGFVNAVLRKVADAGRSVLPAPPQAGDVDALAVVSSLPRWWLERRIERIGWQETVLLAESCNERVATVLRARAGRLQAPALRDRLAAEGIDTEPCKYVAEALRVVAGAPQRTEAFRDGHFWILDEASQIAGMLAAASAQRRVADLCAAPGGKALVIADALPADGLVAAIDRHEGRTSRLARNLQRLGETRVLPLVADSAGANPLARTFDTVLLDAPCSGTGTLRRHPEIRYRLRPDDLTSLAARQGRLLDAAAELLVPEGTLVYSVCSLEPEEGEDAVRAFLDRRGDFVVADPRPLLPAAAHGLIRGDGTIRTWPQHDGLDGFFAAVLKPARPA